MDTNEIKSKIENAKNTLSGVAADIAEKCKETPEMVKRMTEKLNNNHAGDNDFEKDAK